MSTIDYNEQVTLLGYEEGRVLPAQTIVTTLAEAVRTIVETWSGDQLDDVFIATPSRSIAGMKEVRAIYDRNDFPLPQTT